MTQFEKGQRVRFLADGPEDGVQVEVEGEVIDTVELETGTWVHVDSGEPDTYYGVKPIWMIQPENLTLIETEGAR